MKDTETKFDFLVAAISDTQEIIRFIDAKAAVATIAIGGILAAIFPDIKSIHEGYCAYPCYVRLLIWIMAIGICLSIYCLIRVIAPIGKIYGDEIAPRFYLTSNKKNKWINLFPRKSDISLPVKKYQKQIAEADAEDIINSLTCELYTVSYIREVKSKRLNNLLSIIVVTAIIFTITYILIS